MLRELHVQYAVFCSANSASTPKITAQATTFKLQTIEHTRITQVYIRSAKEALERNIVFV